MVFHHACLQYENASIITWSNKITYLKPGGHGFQPFNLRILQCRVGGNGAEHFEDLLETSLECVKLPKYVHLTEVKLSLWGSLFQFFLGFMETQLVLLDNATKSVIFIQPASTYRKKKIFATCILIVFLKIATFSWGKKDIFIVLYKVWFT